MISYKDFTLEERRRAAEIVVHDLHLPEVKTLREHEDRLAEIIRIGEIGAIYKVALDHLAMMKEFQQHDERKKKRKRIFSLPF